MSTDRESEPLVQPAPPSEEAGSGGRVSSRRGGGGGGGGRNMLPGRERRSLPERLLVRLIATCGIVGIGVAIGAIMVSSHDKGWIVGLVVSIVSVVLAAILWSSRVL